MRYYLVTDADGPSQVGVPDGQGLGDLGYGGDAAAGAVEIEEALREAPHALADGSATVDWRPLDAELHARIDASAGAFRGRFITDVAGQMATYLDKEKEARAWSEEADPALFPYLRTEAEVRGIGIAEQAALVIDAADRLRGLGVLVEALRMGAKRAVTAAATEAEKRAAAAVDWDALLAPPPAEEDGEPGS